MADTAVAARGCVHIVVTCANRKTTTVPEKLRLSSLRERRAGQRFAAWTHRLTTSTVPVVPAADLYAGEHWLIARELPDAPGRPAKLWVCSAGYGLIDVHTAIRPYAATFAADGSDAVAASVSQVQDWWSRLTQWPDPAPGQPRSFADLARRDPGATIVAVLSDAYLRACAKDLRAAAGLLARGEQLAVIGPPGRCADVDEFIVPVTARLRPVVGGSLQALNVRVAAHLLAAVSKSHLLNRRQLSELARQATESAPPDPSRRGSGQKLSDDEVRAYIRAQAACGPGTATRLLRRLRQSGQSCEQLRFKRLFMEVVRAGVSP
jgi:hypothetical protein